jgi:hypothetical protein
MHEAGVQFGAMEKEEEKTSLHDNFFILTTSEILPFLWTSGYDTETSRVPDYFIQQILSRKGY